ncbi:MAG: hypothetical protein Q7K11_00565 [Candidatus Berkelbacteria bacterium]|nr:hypothetical protein [Candidatus Berkelbacteria bacterium]
MEKTVILKTGKEADEHLVQAVVYALRNLLQSNPIAFMGLMEKCRNDSYMFFGNSQQILEEVALVDKNGIVPDGVKDIVLASTEGEIPNLRIVAT